MIQELRAILTQNVDPDQAEKMAAYMQKLFPFAGIPKPKLKELIRPFLQQTAKLPLDWQLVFDLWETPEREAQYIALEYLQKHRRQIVPEDLEKLQQLITQKSWWETVDTLDAFVGELVLQDTSLKQVLLRWAEDENIWLRRVAIDFQQEYKEKTDALLLGQIIEKNLGSNEFFINKAIGWSLRDYSKEDPRWVAAFVEQHKARMAPLSVKEATKLIS